MNDRELLELAAKAAGIGPIIGFDDHLTAIIGPIKWTRQWAPLADDGDALRLAVELRLRIEHEPHTVYVGFSGEQGEDIAAEPVYKTTPSREESTRRAIVRAAAEIGRNMP